ncbi:MAG: hypothetical protein OHK93_001204 [Ramalina farinacea]|uniref:Uncharacterized protein n=1 Tax=Ramalina farinacea TaxID=258253 RepID=A0AA43TXG5_9LECA|nr:hypothetical protein [Ramalina farinacea]
MTNSNWADGVAAVTQCGIPPGQKFTYEFNTVGQMGTYWYRSHLSTQYTDGLLGPVVIHSPAEVIPEVDDERIIFMGDCILLNGENTYNCSVNSTIYPSTTGSCTGGSVYTTKVESRKRYRLRLINHSTLFSYWFSNDNHTESIVEMDGVEVEPIPFRGVLVNIGQRFSIIVQTNQTTGNYCMRASLPKSCFLPGIPYIGPELFNAGLDSAGYHALGVLSYDDTLGDALPSGVARNTSNPNGTAENPFNDQEWEGCVDMPFDIPKLAKAMEAFDISEGNTHYIQFNFAQVQHVSRVLVNQSTAISDGTYTVSRYDQNAL